MMTYSIDDLLNALAEEVTFADKHSMRRKVIEVLRTQLWPTIGFELVGLPFTQPVAVGAEGRVELPEHVLKVEDASDNGHSFMAVTQPVWGVPHRYTMQRDPQGVSFPFYDRATIWIKGYALMTDPNGNLLIPEACYAAAYHLTLANVLNRLYTHPRFGERAYLMAQVPGLCGQARAQLVGSGYAAQLRTENYFMGVSQSGSLLDPSSLDLFDR